MYKGRCNVYPGVTYHTIETLYTIHQNYQNLPRSVDAAIKNQCLILTTYAKLIRVKI